MPSAHIARLRGNAQLRRRVLEPRQPEDLSLHRRTTRHDARAGRRPSDPARRPRTTSVSRSARRSRIAASTPESFRFYAGATRSRRRSAATAGSCSSARWKSRSNSARAEFFEQRRGYGCDDPVTDLHRRPAAGRLDAAGADPRLALAGRRHHGTGRHSAAGQLARPASEWRALPGRARAALGGRLPRLRRDLHSRHATLPGRRPGRSSSTRCRTISATSA